jgi:PadR family transcriptional regulator PadR
MPPERFPIPQGTLDMLVLQILSLGPAHGYAIAQRIEQISRHAVQVNQGSLYPALQRLEQKEWIDSEWRVTDNNRRAKYYRLTASGQRQLEQHRERWNRVSFAVSSVLEGA